MLVAIFLFSLALGGIKGSANYVWALSRWRGVDPGGAQLDLAEKAVVRVMPVFRRFIIRAREIS
ncbi:hypothetical protein TorRG33x02_222900, partial [Trema orientale]